MRKVFYLQDKVSRVTFSKTLHFRHLENLGVTIKTLVAESILEIYPENL